MCGSGPIGWFSNRAGLAAALFVWACSSNKPSCPAPCRAINRLAVAGCGTFFASASSDETIKVGAAAW